MLSLNELSAFIQALSKSEKRYVALYCQLQEGSKAYWYLYQLIQRAPGEAGTIPERFASRYSPALLEAARKHLYKMLMKALRSYHAEKSLNRQLLNLLQDVELLFEKGIIPAAFRQLEKGKKLALQAERFSHYLLLARQELRYLTELEFYPLSEAELVARQEQMNEVLYHQLYSNKHAAINEILLYRYFHWGPTRSPRENEQLNDLLLEEYQVNANKRFRSRESTRLHLHFQSVYFLMTGQYEESMKLYQSLETLFAGGTEKAADVYYIYLINGILTGLRSTRNYPAMHQFLEALKTLAQKYSGPRTQLQQLITGHTLGILIDRGQFAEGLRVLEQSGCNPAESANTGISYSRALLSFHAAVIYFGLEQYHAALARVNEAYRTEIISASQSLYSLFRLLTLLIHFELDDADYLTYEIRSVERKLQRQKKLYQTEKVIIRFLKQPLPAGNCSEQWTQLYEHLRTLADDPYEKPIFRSFDFLSWVAAKLRKVPFARMVEQREAAGWV